MRSYVLAREPDGLRIDLGTGAADVARIVSEVRDRVQGVELRPAGDPEDDRWRLLQAVTSFLRNASTRAAAVHRAGRPALGRPRHAGPAAARRAQPAGRAPADRRHLPRRRGRPHAPALRHAGRPAPRVDSFQRVPLRGLTVDEVHRMYEAIRGQDVPGPRRRPSIARPKATRCSSRRCCATWSKKASSCAKDGRCGAARRGSLGVGIPEGLRDVIGKRLRGSRAECNRLLAIAAVIGRDFGLDTLQQVAGYRGRTLVSALEEAVELGCWRSKRARAPSRYRFAHAFFRQTLYEEMMRAAAPALAPAGGARAGGAVRTPAAEEHAAELAEHFGHPQTAPTLQGGRVRRVGGTARHLVFDYGEAATPPGTRLDVQEILDPDDKLKRCDLLLDLGAR